MNYVNFAYYYDSLMDEEFYQQYYEFIISHAKFNTVLELGCGTGIMAIKLSKANKMVYATDLSKHMLEVAKNNAMHENVDLMLGRVDMTDFQINEPVDLVLCLCDSINYIQSRKKVQNVFNNVYNALSEHGTFIFDAHSLHKINTTFADYKEEVSDDDFYFKWEVKKISEGKIHHLVQIDDFENNEHVLEEHDQVTLSVDSYIEMLKKAHFSYIKVFSDFKEYNQKDDRVIFIVKK